MSNLSNLAHVSVWKYKKIISFFNEYSPYTCSTLNKKVLKSENEYYVRLGNAIKKIKLEKISDETE